MTSLRHTIVRETGVSLVINAMIGVLMGWLTLSKGGMLILLGGPQSAGFGVLAVSALFPFVATMLLSTMLLKKIANGDLALDKGREISRFIKIWPTHNVLRALFLSLFSVCIIAPISLFTLNAILGSKWTYNEAMTLQFIYPMILALIITPIIVKTAVRYIENS